MSVHGFQDTGQEEQELPVFVRLSARVQQVLPVVSGEGPVVVLAGAVDAGKGLFVEQADQSLLVCHPLQRLHHDLVVVCRHICFRVDGGQLMLRRSHFVVLSLGRDTHLPQLFIDLAHVCGNSLADGAEIMVVQLLALGRHGSEEGAAGVDQVLALEVFLPVYDEIFLLRADGRNDLGGGGVAEQTQYPERLLLDGLHGAQKRSLLVQSLPGEGAEGSGNAENSSGSIFPDECRGRAVPGGVAPCLKGGPQSSGGEGGSVRLALDQVLAGELHEDGAVLLGRRDKRIMFFSGKTGKRLEPVGVVGGAFFNGPFFNGGCHDIRSGGIQFLSALDGLVQFMVDALGEVLAHGLLIKYIGSEDIHDRLGVFRIFFHK